MVSVVNRHDREPLRPIEVLPRQGSRPSDLNGRYPTVLATTGSCARPRPSPSLWSSLGLGVCAGCCEPLLRRGPSRRYLCVSVPRCMDPYPGGVVGARTHCFPTTIGLPPVLMGSASRVNPFSDFRTGGAVGAAVIHACSGLEVCCHPGRSHRSTLQYWAAVAYTSEQHTGRYLPVHRIC